MFAVDHQPRRGRGDAAHHRGEGGAVRGASGRCREGGQRRRPWSTPAWRRSGGSTCWSTMSASRAPGAIVTTEEADWDLVNDVNLKSVYLACKQVVPIMERQGKGAIVNIASIAGAPLDRHQLCQLLRHQGRSGRAFARIALESGAKGIRCNSVSPGLMNTPMVHHGLTGGLRRGRRRRQPGPGARRAMPDGPHGRRLGHGARLPVSGLRRGEVRHRARPGGRRRPHREVGVSPTGPRPGPRGTALDAPARRRCATVAPGKALFPGNASRPANAHQRRQAENAKQLIAKDVIGFVSHFFACGISLPSALPVGSVTRYYILQQAVRQADGYRSRCRGCARAQRWASSARSIPSSSDNGPPPGAPEPQGVTSCTPAHLLQPLQPLHPH